MKIEILNNQTGEIRDVSNQFDTWDDDIGVFLWEEHNYSCDCNRRLFFERSIDADFYEDGACGEELFSVRISEDDGKLKYSDGRFGDFGQYDPATFCADSVRSDVAT